MSEELNPEQLQRLEEFSVVALSSGVTTLSILLNKQVSLHTPSTQVIGPGDLGTLLHEPLVSVEVPASVKGTSLNLAFIITQQDTAIITDLMMGGEGTPPSAMIDDLQLSAISEAVNQMLGMAANTLNTTYGKKLEFQPPVAGVIDNPEDAVLPTAFQSGRLVVVTFQMVIEGLTTSRLVLMLPMATAAAIAEIYQAPASDEKTVAQAPAAPAPAAAAPPPPPPAAAPPAAASYAPSPAAPMYAPPPAAPPAAPVNAQPAQFAPLPGMISPGQAPSGLDLVLDVPLRVTVELGRTRMQIRDVLELGKGSVVELDKLAGEPVDLLVNGKLIARGEVVVIDENFGIRVTDIVSPAERFSSFSRV